MNRAPAHIAFVIALALTTAAMAYPVGPPLGLDKMTAKADLVFKGRAVSSAEAKNAAFKPIGGFKVIATKLQVISVFKGDPDIKTVTFYHYAPDPTQGDDFEPPAWSLKDGRSYIIFAGKTETGVLSQLSLYPTGKTDEGVLLAADDHPRAGMSVKQVYWTELTGLLASADSADIEYAMQQLDEMSGGGWGDSKEFDRKDVAEAIRPLLATKDEKVLAAVLMVAGSKNPYMRPDNAQWWLVTVGSGHLPGIGKGDPKFDNPTARLLFPDLVKLANSAAPGAVRAQAIRVLGRTSVDELPANLQRWATDRDALVRQAAVVLLADVPGEASQRQIESAAGDSSADVRQGAAQAIGFGQIISLVPLLGKLLKDDAPAVHDAAAMSLLSFSPAVSGDLLRANINDPEYRSLFVNALATDNPAPYVGDLEEILSKHLQPTRFWGGQIPAGDTWNILFKYIQSRPAEDFNSGKLDGAFDALEKMQWYSSSEPRDLYALYVQHGLNDRAKTFRERCRKEITYDIDYYFKMVDESPGTYKRE